MKNKGFTMIELLAVIVILAIIAIIATPVVIKTINNAREKAFLDDAITLRKAADNYYAESNLSQNQMIPLLVTYNNRNVTYCNNKPKLSYSGKNPYSGNIYINTDGTVEMKLYDSKTGNCAVKTKEDKEPHLEKLSESECKLSAKAC